MKINTELKYKLRKTFNKYDIIEIYESDKVNLDEYDPEIKLVLKLFKKKLSSEKFIDELHKIFIKMFDERIAGPKSKYENIAKEVYSLLIRKSYQL